MVLGSLLKDLVRGGGKAIEKIEETDVDSSETKLHLGCGPNVMPGWVNIDVAGESPVVRHDLTQPLPVKSDAIEYIFNEHFIEHLTRDQGRFLLGECHRVLKPGGIVRVSTPDLRILVEQYLGNDLQPAYKNGWYPATACQLLNDGMRLWGHQFLFDESEFLMLFRESGFVNIALAKWKESVHPALRGLESRPFQSDLIVEATK